MRQKHLLTMATCDDICREMQKRGPYMTAPIGKCIRSMSAYQGNEKSRIDLYLRRSVTYQASCKGTDLKSLFDPKREVEGVLVWVEDRKKQENEIFPVLVDETSGIIKSAGKGNYGCLEDVEGCLFRKSKDGTLIPWHESKRTTDEGWAAHTDEEINASDSSKGTIGSGSSSQRIGQGHWRKRVMLLRGAKCQITGCSHPRLLRASHIKRWAEATTDERLDAHNGLLLAAHVDAAFEVGLLSFGDNGKILISDRFTEEDRRALAIPANTQIPLPISAETKKYLAWHRQEHGF